MPLFVKFTRKSGLSARTGADLLELGLNYRLICKTCPLLLDLPGNRDGFLPKSVLLDDRVTKFKNFKKEQHCYILRSVGTGIKLWAYL